MAAPSMATAVVLQHGLEQRSHLTTLLCCSSLSRLISRMAVLGTPSSSCSRRIFFSAMVAPLVRSRALYTTPYVPSPIFSTFSYCAPHGQAPLEPLRPAVSALANLLHLFILHAAPPGPFGLLRPVVRARGG